MRTEEESQSVGWIHLPGKRWYLLAAGLYAGYYFGLRRKPANRSATSTGLPEPDFTSIAVNDSQTENARLANTAKTVPEVAAEGRSLLEPVEEAAPDEIHMVRRNGPGISHEDTTVDESAQISERAIANAGTEPDGLDATSAAIMEGEIDEPSESVPAVALVALDSEVEDSQSPAQVHPQALATDALASETADDGLAVRTDEVILRKMPDWLLPDYEDDIPASATTDEAAPELENKPIPVSLMERIEAYHRRANAPAPDVKPVEEQTTPAEQEPEGALTAAAAAETPEDTAALGDESPAAREETDSKPQAEKAAPIRLAGEHQEHHATEPKYIRLRRRRYNRTGI